MTRDVNVPSKVYLGLCVYDTTLDRLQDSAGRDIKLRPQSAQVLSLLVANLGQTVTKDHLVSNVWQNLSVTDDSLMQCIADIRRALNDTNRQILRTRPKIGYLLSPTHMDVSAPDATGHTKAMSPNPVWVCLDAFCGDTRTSLSEADLSALQKSGGCLEHRVDSVAIFSFDEALSALRFAIGLHTSSGKLSYRVGVDMMPAEHAAVADPSELLVTKLSMLAQPTETVACVELRDLCYGELEFDFEDLGPRTVPDSPDVVRAYRVHKKQKVSRLLPELASEDVLPTIAIIPLRSYLGSPDTVVVGEIVADSLIAAMSQSADLNVTSRLSTTVFRGQADDLAKIGDVLGADFVLSGMILTQDTQIAMTLEFSEVSSGKVLWADRVELEIATLLRESEAVAEIVSKIRQAVALHEVARARSSPISTLRNYSLLIGAVGLMHRLAPTDFQLAGEMLRTLIERNPNQPAALSWMARWHVLRVQQGWSDDPQKEAQLALACSTKALDIDPENALALTSEGFVLTNLLHKLDQAEDRYDAALAANPNDANGRLLRGTLFAFQGKGQAAKRDCERALHLAPIDPHRFFFLALAASANIAAEDYERAMLLAKNSLRMNRTHTSTLRVKVVAQMRLGNTDAARETTRELLRLQPNLSVSAWLKSSPSANFKVGRNFAETLREAGVPE